MSATVKWQALQDCFVGGAYRRAGEEFYAPDGDYNPKVREKMTGQDLDNAGDNAGDRAGDNAGDSAGVKTEAESGVKPAAKPAAKPKAKAKTRAKAPGVTPDELPTAVES